MKLAHEQWMGKRPNGGRLKLTLSDHLDAVIALFIGFYQYNDRGYVVTGKHTFLDTSREAPSNSFDAKAGSGIISSILPNPASALHHRQSKCPSDTHPSNLVSHRPSRTSSPARHCHAKSKSGENLGEKTQKDKTYLHPRILYKNAIVPNTMIGPAMTTCTKSVAFPIVCKSEEIRLFILPIKLGTAVASDSAVDGPESEPLELEPSAWSWSKPASEGVMADVGVASVLVSATTRIRSACWRTS